MKGKSFQSLRVISLLFLALLGVGCGKLRPNQGAFRFQIPMPESGGTYGLQDVEVHSLRDIMGMQGDAAELKVRPILTDSGLEGEHPKARFLERSDSVLVPTDEISMYLATLYVHAEKLRDLEFRLGVNTGVPYPRQIGVAVALHDPKAGPTRRVLNNALYVPKNDVTLFVPYSKAELPIALNAGVIAHEHFHAVFHSKVGRFLPQLQKAEGVSEFGQTLDAQAKPSTPSRGRPEVKSDIKTYNQFFVRALNEGLADFWAWVYTGQADFLAASVSERNEGRRLDRFALIGLPSVYDQAVAATDDPDFRNAIAYDLGTSLARFMMQFSVFYNQVRGESQTGAGIELSESQRAEMGRRLLRSLDRVRDVIQAKLSQNVRVTPRHFVQTFLNSFDESQWPTKLCSWIQDSFVKIHQKKSEGSSSEKEKAAGSEGEGDAVTGVGLQANEKNEEIVVPGGGTTNAEKPHPDQDDIAPLEIKACAPQS